MHIRAAVTLAFIGAAVGVCVLQSQVPDSRFRSGVAVVEVTVSAASPSKS